MKALLDLKFKELITPKIMSIVYAVAGGLIVLGGLICFVAAASHGGLGAFAGLVIILPLTFVELLLLRVGMEGVAAFYRIADDVQAVRRQLTAPAGTDAPVRVTDDWQG